MSQKAQISRVVLRNFKSIALCDVSLGALTYLVGPNGAGKSNFLEALHLVNDALTGSLDQALSTRGGLGEVRRKSSGHPTHFGIRLELQLLGSESALYAFNVGALSGGGFEVQEERCAIGAAGHGPSFEVKRGVLVRSSESTFPAVTPDRLALVAASGLSAFRPVFDALSAIGLYNFNPKLMREPQRAQDGRLLRPTGDNLASVVRHLERSRPDAMRHVEEYLRSVVPSVQGVSHLPVGPFETLKFRQDVAGAKHPWYFPAMNMSDGTLRALAVLVALFQGDEGQEPTLVGIEEPETALHPAAAGALREALKVASAHTQILVTSHSPELLDDADVPASQIRVVRQRDSRTEIAAVDPASREMMREGLFSPGELLRLGQLEPDSAEVDSLARRQIELFADIE